MRGATLVAAGLGSLGLLACLGPYPNIGERLDVGSRVSGTSYITPFGLEKKTSLPRDVIEKAAGRLKRAGARRWTGAPLRA